MPIKKFGTLPSFRETWAANENAICNMWESTLDEQTRMLYITDFCFPSPQMTTVSLFSFENSYFWGLNLIFKGEDDYESQGDK